MYINPLAAVALFTIIVEIIIAFEFAVYYFVKSVNNDKKRYVTTAATMPLERVVILNDKFHQETNQTSRGVNLVAQERLQSKI